MPRFRKTVPVDDYVLDVLLRDLVAHDQQPSAFLVYLFLFGRAARQRWRPVPMSLRMIAEETGLSKSAVQTALDTLRYRELIVTARAMRPRRPDTACSGIGCHDFGRTCTSDARSRTRTLAPTLSSA